MAYSFNIPGGPGVMVTVADIGNDLQFTVNVGNAGGQTADLRGLFFNVDEALRSVSDLNVVLGTNATDRQVAKDAVIDLGDGANMQGAANAFDVGVEFGVQGIGKGDDIKSGTFTLTSKSGANLGLDLIDQMQFGTRLTSVGTDGGAREDSLKLVGESPRAAQTMTFGTQTGSPLVWSENGLLVHSHYPQPGTEHLHIVDRGGDGDAELWLHDGYSSEPYEFHAANGGTFSLFEMDIIDVAGSSTFKAFSGATLVATETFSAAGHATFGAGFQNVDRVVWETTSGMTVDDLIFGL